MFENLSLPHLLMVLAVAILVFGPKRIPEIAGSMGKGIREFKRTMTDAGRIDESDEAPVPMVRTDAPEDPASGAPKRLLQ
ncbi:MAG TPA: twin-arginine translocase TatA/TatE family subunit [Gemmatimonadaceae bacterium]